MFNFLAKINKYIVKKEKEKKKYVRRDLPPSRVGWSGSHVFHGSRSLKIKKIRLISNPVGPRVRHAPPL